MSAQPVLITDHKPARGRIAIVDQEAAHPLGRWLQRQQGVGFSICAQTVYYRQHRAKRLEHDAHCDDAVREMVRAAETLRESSEPWVRDIARVILHNGKRYAYHDPLEDGEAHAGDQRVSLIQQFAQRLNAAFDRVLGLLRGGKP